MLAGLFRRKRRTVVVWFAGLHGGLRNFEQLADFDLDSIGFIDENLDWYLGGVAQLGGSWDESMAVLRQKIAGRRAVFAGSSSGGYAALRAALDCNPDRCVIFSPQTGDAPCPAPPLPNLVDEMYLRRPRFDVRIHLARSEDENRHAFFWDDWRQVERLAPLPHVSLVEHPYDHHAFVGPMNKRGELFPFLAAEAVAPRYPKLSPVRRLAMSPPLPSEPI